MRHRADSTAKHLKNVGDPNFSLPTDDGGDPGILMKLKGVGSEEVPTKDVILEMISLTKLQEQLHQYNKDAEESLHMSLGEMTPEWLTS